MIEEETDEEQEEPALDNPSPSLLLSPLPIVTNCQTNGMLPIQETGSSSSIQPIVHVEALFEKMASSMIIMDLCQETQTTLVLDHPHLSGSVFFGTTITIKEFSTAPKAFNVEILSNPTAIATILQQQDHLLSLFAKGNFPFTIHRFDSGIQQETMETPLINRYTEREKEEGQKEKQEDQNP